MEFSDKVECFVIMPFSGTTDLHTTEYWTNHFDKFLKPQIERNNKIRCYRSQALREDILDEIISSLITIPIVVADLTDHNSNVFWELGVRQSFSNRTLTIAEIGTKLPFDVKSKGTLFYHPNDHIKNESFILDFQSALTDCLRFPNKPDSLVLNAIGGRGTLYQTIEKDKILRQLDGLLAETMFNKDLTIKIKNYVDKTIAIMKQDKKKDEPKLRNKLQIFPRIRKISVEHLITNRYVSNNNNFYQKIEFYYDYLNLLDQYIKDLAGIFNMSIAQISIIFRDRPIEIVDVENLIQKEIQYFQELK